MMNGRCITRSGKRSPNGSSKLITDDVILLFDKFFLETLSAELTGKYRISTISHLPLPPSILFHTNNCLSAFKFNLHTISESTLLNSTAEIANTMSYHHHILDKAPQPNDLSVLPPLQQQNLSSDFSQQPPSFGSPQHSASQNELPQPTSFSLQSASINFIASGSGSIVTGLTMTPLDVLSKRIQANALRAPVEHYHAASKPPHSTPKPLLPAHVQHTLLATLRTIVKTEGVLRLWTGLKAGLIMSIPNTITYFSSYEILRHIFLQRQLEYIAKTANGPKDDRTTQLCNSILTSSSLPPFFAGVFSRFLCTFVVSPIDLIRTRQQTFSTSPNTSIPSMTSIFQSIIQPSPDQPRQLSNLYRGIIPTLLRDIPFSALYWTLNERLKGVLLHSPNSPFYSSPKAIKSPSQTPQSTPNNNSTHISTWSASFCSGAISGAMAALLTHPFEVIKTAQQLNYSQTSSPTPESTSKPAPTPSTTPATVDLSKTSMIKTAQHLYKSNGMKGLFVGCVPRVTKVAPACAIMLSSYDITKRLLGGNPNHSHPQQYINTATQKD